jgi:alkylation response protein AidB-like acyl-CoA dehydrogenase
MTSSPGLATSSFPFEQRASAAEFEAFFASAEKLAHWLRSRGAAADRRGGKPLEELAELRRSGLLAVTQPRSVGGGGASWPQALQLVRLVSASDMSIGQLLGYHYLNGRFVWIEGSAAQTARLGAESVKQSWYWGGVVNPRDPSLHLEPRGDDFVLNGRKNFATGASIADLIVVPVLLDGALVAIAVPAQREGFRSLDDWDNFGQRLTESGGVEFRDFIVKRDEVLGGVDRPPGPPPAFVTLVTPMIQLIFVNLYLGAAQGALDEAKDYVRSTTRPWGTSGVNSATEDPYILAQLGDSVADLSASIALADHAGEVLQAAIERGTSLTEDVRTQAAAVVYAAKVHATRVSLEVTSGLFELTGARSTANRYGFDRFWRNVRTHTLHDPVVYKAREVGNFALNGRIANDPFYT